jgi:predicted  nucleic acid-binding Zn-ribbon protein
MVERLTSAGIASSIGASTADGTMNMDSISHGNKHIGQQIVGPRLDTSSSMNDGRFNMTYASNGEQFVDERGSQLVENYRGSAMLSQMLQESYQGSVSDLNSLSTQESRQASRVEAARQHFAENFSMDKGAMASVNKQVAEAMQIVANNGASLNENVSENKSKSTATNSGMGANVGASFSTGTSATNNDAVSKDSSHQSSMRFEEAASIVDNYAKSHNISESSSERKEAGNSLNQELSKMEQISEQKAAVQQRVESLSNQIAFTSQQSSAIDKNYNDEVLDQVMKSHGVSNKAEAAQYLSGHRQEGQEILKSLVERDSGVGMSGIGNIAEARNMSHKVHNSTNFEPPVYKKGAEALEKGYNESSEVDNRTNEVKYGVEENQDLVRTAVGTSPQYTVDGKTPQEVRDAVQGGKKALDQKYAKTPDSTIRRTVVKSVKDVAHVPRDLGRFFRGK